MLFNAVSAAKLVATGIVGIGTGKIVGAVIKNHVRPETMIDKVTVMSASWVIGGIATKAAKNYTNETIDEAVGAFTKLVGGFKQNAALGRISRGESTFAKEGLDQSKFRKENGKWVPISDEDWKDNQGKSEYHAADRPIGVETDATVS